MLLAAAGPVQAAAGFGHEAVGTNHAGLAQQGRERAFSAIPNGPSPTTPAPDRQASRGLGQIGHQTPTELGQSSSAAGSSSEAIMPVGPEGLERVLSPERVSYVASTLLLLAIVSLAPALLLMTTCFVRLLIVFALARQAIGPASLPSNQVLVALALFMTAVVMSPVWRQVYFEAYKPYRAEQIDEKELVARALVPVRDFMARQILRTGNTDDVWLFLDRAGYEGQITSFEQVPFYVLAPAFLLSELKTAFLIGFQLYLPFLAIDLLVASLLSSLGMLNLPTSAVSLPFKLLLFVLADGWHLLAGALLDSFA